MPPPSCRLSARSVVCSRSSRRATEGEQEKRKMKMRKILMTTVAAAALAGFTTVATAQTMQTPSGSAAKPESNQPEQKGAVGGALKYQGSGPQSTDKATPPTGNTAQGTPNAAQPTAAKPDQKMDESRKNEANPQRGAQDERSAPQKGAQQEIGKSGVNAETSHSATSRGKSGGTSVQISQDQRSRIGAIIGKNAPVRASSNVKFDVTVGAKVPENVHVIVLPEDVVQIVPQYEGYDYIVVGDQILIVDPDDLEIVAV